MAEVGSYTIHLYCDNENPNYHEDMKVHENGEFPHEFVDGEFSYRCRTQARRYGWVFKRDGTVLCPKCSGKGTTK